MAGPSPHVFGEFGLFTAQQVRDGDIVRSFEATSKTYLQFMRWLKSTGLQDFEDAGLRYMDRVLCDPAFTGLDKIPMWYRLNHSYFPNLEMYAAGVCCMQLFIECSSAAHCGLS